MPDYLREKGKHLTREDRYEIQRGLREHRTFTEIALLIGCSPDTISKEIRKHRYHKPHDNRRFVPNQCKLGKRAGSGTCVEKKAGTNVRFPAGSAHPVTADALILCIIHARLHKNRPMSVMLVQGQEPACLINTCIMQIMQTGNTERNCGNQDRELT